MYLDDLAVGQEFDVGPRNVTAEEVRTFSTLTGDRNPLHLDEAFARTTRFGRIVAHGMLTLSLALGLWSEHGYTREGLVALVGLDHVRFRLPVSPGDAIRMHSRVERIRTSESRPGSGFVVVHDRVFNQREELVLELDRTLFLQQRGA